MNDAIRDPDQPLNAQIINDGEGSQDAVDLGHGIFMSRDVSNLYRIVTDQGDVLINTGMIFSAEENQRRLNAVSSNAIQKIIFTQSHEDHIGGWRTFTGPDVETIAQVNIGFVRTYFRDLGPAMARRSRQLWKRDQKRNVTERPEPIVDTTFFDSHRFILGHRAFELYSVPGGETLDSLLVWMPDEKICFSGNLTGPIFGHLPNLYTVRGDHIRYVQWFLDSIQRLIDLEPETLITGHGQPIKGAKEILGTLTRIRDATQFIRDRTFEGMNAGVDLWTLMRDISLPDHLAVPQGHGKVSWVVRAIWEEHLGWFRYESTTELYDIPARSIFPDLVSLAGGAAPVLARAEEMLLKGRPLEAMHLSEAVIEWQPDCSDAIRLLRAATQLLLEQQGRENFSEVRWLEGEIAALSGRLGEEDQ